MEKLAKGMKGPMRVIAPIAISAALHAGVLFGIPAVQGWIQERQAAPLSSKEPLQEGITRINKSELRLLEQKKEEYVSELLSSLRKGEAFRLSGFYIKSEVLDANISRAKKGEPLFSEQQYLERYDYLVSRAKKYVAGKPDKLKGVYHFFHKIYVRGYNPEMPGMLDILDTEWGNCNSSTQLFASLVQDVAGIPQKFLLFDDHIASFIGGRRIENTEHKWKEANVPYDNCGAVLPTDIAVAAYVTTNGVDVDSLPRRLKKFYKRSWGWTGGCLAKPPKNKKDFATTPAGFPALGVDSGLTMPDGPVPNDERETKDEQLKKEDVLKYAKAIKAIHAFSSAKDGSSGKLEAFTPIDLPSGLDWEQFMDQMKGWFVFSKIMAYYPKEHVCANKALTLDELEILSILRSFQNASLVDLQARLCSKCAPFALKGTPAELIKDFPYGFCREERSVVMERYLSERWYQWPTTSEINQLYHKLDFKMTGDYILVLLSNYAAHEDFEFFRNEFETREYKDTKNYASYGMINADFARSCNGIFKNPENVPPNLSSIIIACHDQDTIWESFQTSTTEDIRELTFVRGDYISEEKAALLASFGKSLYSSGEKPVGLLKVARILVEYADTLGPHNFKKQEYSSLAEQFSIKAAELLANKDADLTFIEFPPSHIHFFQNLMEKDKFILPFSQRSACIGTRQQFSEATIKMLKSIFESEEQSKIKRIKAAVVLLDLGIDPLAKL